ncbi:sulfite exporter TauE/SafE family protein [bacterium]|nr:sulfite exporter TauE/SafE family protein [bacterium]
MVDVQTLQILAIIFLATFIGSTFGFGLGLVAMPLLAFIVDLKTATPLVAIVAATTAFFIFINNWRQVNFKSIWKMILASIVGIPIGLYILKGAGDSFMKTMLALMIILFAAYSLYGRGRLRLATERSSVMFGLLSGIIGSAYNMGGPPVIIYGALRNWPPITFRATMQSFFLPVGIFIVISHTLGGLVTSTVLRYYGYSFPILIFTTFMGGILNRSIPTERFKRYIFVFLLLIGIFLLLKTMF